MGCVCPGENFSSTHQKPNRGKSNGARSSWKSPSPHSGAQSFFHSPGKHHLSGEPSFYAVDNLINYMC